MRWIHLECIDSTNTYAKQHCAAWPKEEITCISAESQTAGRGRELKPWVSPAGVNLYATFYFRLPSATPDLTHLAQLMAYSCAAILEKHGLHPTFKWPNDILLRGKKVSGILCETEFHKEEVDLFLGIGLNVNWEKIENVDQPATSLFLETGKKWDKEALLKELQMEFAHDLAIFRVNGFAPFHKKFRASS